MKKYFILSLSIPLSILISLIGDEEKQISEKIAIGLRNWSNNYPQEKVFLQIDRKHYVGGEDIWFKATCTYNNKPTFLSRIIYIDLVNEIGEVIEKKMFKLDSSGSCNGNFFLNKKQLSGNYSINAYTLWMLNYPDFIAKQSIFVYGADYTKKVFQKPEQKIIFDFFPEGGNLIAGIKNRVAFKITNQFGLPLNLAGNIVNSSNDVITTFTSKHDGMGFFEFEPSATENYLANIQYQTGTVLAFKLPSPIPEGITLNIQNTKNRFFAIINRGEANKEKYNNLILMAHINGQLVYAGAFDFNNSKTAAAIAKKNLPPGIIHFTVFDTLANPLAERLAFSENYEICTPKIDFKKKSLSKRGENILAFNIDSISSGNMSVLVKSSDADNQVCLNNNILSNLLLTSDIKGTVINPGYYFANKADSTLQNLDLVLMTHGWRRFHWKNIISKSEVSLKYPIESAISIKGRVNKSDRKDIIKDGKVALIIKGEDSTKILADAYLTDKGEFILDSLNFKQKATVFYEGQNNKKQKLPVDVTIYPSYIDSLKRSSFISTENLDTSDISNRKNAFAQSIYSEIGKIESLEFGNTTLANVTVTAKKLSRIDSLQKVYVSSIFENSDNTIDFADAKGMANIWQYLRMQISGFEVEPFGGQFGSGGATARFTRNDGLLGLSEDPSASNSSIMFMLNEIQVDAAFIDNLNPDDVALVKVYKGNTAFPWGANSGMIAIYTKKGLNVRSPFDKTFNKMEIQGFASASREFFSPDYVKYPNINNSLADKRQTLYWNPNIKKQKDGNYFVRFFNNDIGKSFVITIQGIDKEGNIVFYESSIN